MGYFPFLIMKTLIIAALLGSMSAVKLGHRHHHRHHHPKNVGVRFIGTGVQIGDLPKVEAPKAGDAPAKVEGKTAANTDLVEKATPEVSTDEKVEQALAAAKASDKAAEEEGKAAAAAEAAPKKAKEGEGFDLKKGSKLGAIIGGAGAAADPALAAPPTEDEVRAANAAAGKPDALINKEEYKAAKAALKDMKAKLDEEPEPLPEDE